MGWMGTSNELLNYLSVVRADKDPEGKFLVRGNITSFLGMGEEYVVGDDAEYFSEGKPCNLAAGLNSTSYGVRGVKVF